ncbi:hypothetical protein PDG61_21080 [Mycolicibacterium sp. BiH015]|uniref:hypothetical protein n=1 Tax=Mycolicibacterium sp. BiH015 TaxID=3018808 RepID=UPI0022E3A5A0|nr:hypothetical protein [Mycolicibacterium sp. BiH015]MDA2893422.1 hypothetical protein [Mycolicibacterium sp. BiH015]
MKTGVLLLHDTCDLRGLNLRVCAHKPIGQLVDHLLFTQHAHRNSVTPNFTGVNWQLVPLTTVLGRATAALVAKVKIVLSGAGC